MRFTAVLFTAFLAMTGIAAAQDEGHAVPAGGVVSEGFDPTARVAGSRIVGVGFRTVPERAFDPKQVRIAGASATSTICIRAISRDGLYWMRTPYEPEAGNALLLSPFTLQPDRLSAYAAEEMAIYAFEVPARTSTPSAESREADCLAAADDGLTVLPVLSSGTRSEELQILVNSGNRRVQGRLTGAADIELNCEPPESTERIAYDRICGANLGAQIQTGQELELVLIFDDGLTKETKSYKIRLPRTGQ